MHLYIDNRSPCGHTIDLQIVTLPRLWSSTRSKDAIPGNRDPTKVRMSHSTFPNESSARKDKSERCCAKWNPSRTQETIPSVKVNEMVQSRHAHHCCSEDRYGLAVDIWSCGILAYELLVGGPPFEAPSKEATYVRILSVEPFYPELMSSEAKDFIQQALQKDPARRPTAQVLLHHPWVRSAAIPSRRSLIVSPNSGMVLLGKESSNVGALDTEARETSTQQYCRTVASAYLSASQFTSEAPHIEALNSKCSRRIGNELNKPEIRPSVSENHLHSSPAGNICTNERLASSKEKAKGTAERHNPSSAMGYSGKLSESMSLLPRNSKCVRFLGSRFRKFTIKNRVSDSIALTVGLKTNVHCGNLKLKSSRLSISNAGSTNN